MKQLIAIVLATAWAALGETTAGPSANSDALFRAIRASDQAAISAAIASGADPNATDPDGMPALMFAAIVGDAATMRNLLDNGADPNAANRAGATALIDAAADASKATLLISRGANVNVESKAGATPLLIASSADGNAAVVRMMLAKGAQVNVHDRIQGIPALLTGGGNTTPLIAAARLRDPETLKILLAAGAEVNAKDANGARALSDAVLFDNPENVRLLLAAGASVNFHIAVWKHTPLIAAAMHGNAGVVQKLIAAGAEVNAVDASDSTPLMWAAYSEYGDPAAVAALLAAGADPNHVNKWGESALTWATRRGDTLIVAALHAAGARDTAEAGGGSLSAVPTRDALLPDIRSAVEKGLPALQALGTPSFKKTGCISCHNNLLPSIAAATARDRGFHYSQADLAANTKTVDALLRPAVEPLREGLDLVPDLPVSAGYVLEDWYRSGVEPNALTDAVIHRLAQAQLSDGSWAVWAPRPPIESSNVTATALAVHALSVYGPRGRRAEWELRIDRARKWLEAANARTSEERNMRLMGLVWAKAKREVINGAVRAVVAQQRGDGG